MPRILTYQLSKIKGLVVSNESLVVGESCPVLSSEFRVLSLELILRINWKLETDNSTLS